MTTKHKTLIGIAIAIIVVIVLIAVLVFHRRDIHFQSPVIFLPNPQRVISNNKEDSFQENDEVFENPQTYSDKIMQFDSNCVASPVVIVAKVGNSVMLENRSNYQRTIVVGIQSFTIAPFGHVTLSFGTVNSYQVSCDSFDNVGLIGIQ